MSDSSKFSASVVESGVNSLVVKFNRGKSLYLSCTTRGGCTLAVVGRVGSKGVYMPAHAAVAQLPKFLRRKARKALDVAGFRGYAAATCRNA